MTGVLGTCCVFKDIESGHVVHYSGACWTSRKICHRRGCGEPSKLIYVLLEA